jgi:hypothetical protein
MEIRRKKRKDMKEEKQKISETESRSTREEIIKK